MNNKKSVLVIPHLFYPEVASTAQIYTELFLELENDFDITVLCAVPCYSGSIDDKYKEKGKDLYEEKYSNIRILRVPVKEFDKKNKISRIKHILSYYKNCKKQIKKLGKYDVTFVCSQPPIIGGMLGVYSKKKNKSKLIYNIQDFNPEQAEAVMSKVFKPIFYILKQIDKKSCKKSNLVITVGRDMQQTLVNRFHGINVPNNVVINNWADNKKLYPIESTNEKIIEFKKKYKMDNKFIIMYSGNIGLYYDLPNIMDEIIKFKDNKDVIFAFIGEGNVKNVLINKAKKTNMENIRFIPYQDKDFLVYSLNSADFHLVTSAKGIKGVSVPSKIYGILAVDKPFICVTEKNSEAYNITIETDKGLFAETGNYNNIYNTLEKVINHNYTLSNKTAVIYSKDESIKKYINEIKKI